MFACCGLVGTSHLTAKIQIFAPLPTSTKLEPLPAPYRTVPRPHAPKRTKRVLLLECYKKAMQGRIAGWRQPTLLPRFFCPMKERNTARRNSRKTKMTTQQQPSARLATRGSVFFLRWSKAHKSSQMMATSAEADAGASAWRTSLEGWVGFRCEKPPVLGGLLLLGLQKSRDPLFPCTHVAGSSFQRIFWP